MNNSFSLNKAVELGIIDLECIQEQIATMKRKEILDKHPYSVWQGKNGFWYTYLPDESKPQKRILKKRNTQQDIEKVIVDYWEKNDVHTFKDVYYVWREVQDQLVSCNTVAKYNTDYKRFFEGTDFENKDISQIDDDSIRIFMSQTIQKHQLQKEPMRKLFSYINNAFYYARKRGYISNNPTEFIKSKDFMRYCYEPYKDETSKVISDDEMKALQRQFQVDHEKMPNYIPTYAVEFASLTGMRVGEISALRWDHITDNYIIIEFSEKGNSTKTEFWIDKPKNGKPRKFPITNEIRILLNEIESVEKEYGYYCEWVFANEKGRIHAPTISACSKNKCRQLGIDIKGKGIHGYRRTLNSKLKCNGVSSTVAASILGHSKEVNDKYYTFDVSDDGYKAEMLEKINKETISV